MMIFSSLLQRERWVHAVLFWRDFFTLPALVFNLKQILRLVDTYEHSSLFSELRGSVTKSHIRRRNFFSHRDVFLPLASCISFVHLPVFSREMYGVKNTQHRTLLLSAIYLVLPATLVHELRTPALAAQWSPRGTAWEGRGLLPPSKLCKCVFTAQVTKFLTAQGWLKSPRTCNGSLLRQKEKGG